LTKWLAFVLTRILPLHLIKRITYKLIILIVACINNIVQLLIYVYTGVTNS